MHNLFCLYNDTYMYVFRTNHLVLDNQSDPILEKTLLVILGIYKQRDRGRGNR